MKSLPSCGCPCSPKRVARKPADAKLAATSEELESIRNQLGTIERMLSVLFGEAFSRDPASLKARVEGADLIERHFDGIVEQWTDAVRSIFQSTYGVTDSDREQLRNNLSNALIRFVEHLRDPDNLETYVYLHKHCQEGMLSRAKPSQFNTIHIALKQVILDHVRRVMHGKRMEIVRDAVVAAVDERRLMVSQFYIESRERALNECGEKYRNSIDHAPDPMYEIDPESGIVIGVNAAAERRWTALGETLVVGRRLVEFVPPEMGADTELHLEAVRERGWAEAFDLPLGDRYFDVTSAVISYGNKQFIQMILHDVTQKREIMNELLKAERLAATGTFAAGVAHEVNNPLASISSLVQSLLPGEGDPGRRMTLHTILSQITRISTTLKDLVNFSRPSAGHSKEVRLNDLISETLRLITYNKRFNGITLQPQLARDLEAVFADENEIQQVLLNILLNAADATQGPNGLIRVTTDNQPGRGREGARVVIRVTDNGIGIPREHLERVFDPFFTTKPAGSGVGLGLSLCQRIIMANRGTIRIDSEVGKGTTVTISLPVYEAAAAVSAAAVQ